MVGIASLCLLWNTFVFRNIGHDIRCSPNPVDGRPSCFLMILDCAEEAVHQLFLEMAEKHGFGQSSFRSYLLASLFFGYWVQKVEVLAFVNSNSTASSHLDHIHRFLFKAIMVSLHLEMLSIIYLCRSNGHQNFDKLHVSCPVFAI